MTKIDLSIADITFIMSEIEKNSKKIDQAKDQIKNSTQMIGNKWKDQQYEIFKQQMVQNFKTLDQVVKDLEIEYERLKNYRNNLKKATDKFK